MGAFDMDMWWMEKPDRSNLPELAVGAFLQGRQQAQRKAEFDAMLPLEVAESNARTAANVAQMNIATKKADREVAEWERIDREEPILQDFSRQIATWYSDPLNKGDVPFAPNGLSGENLAKANKLMLDASIAKRVQVANSEVGMARAKEMEDTANLIATGYLDEAKAGDFEAKKLARFNRAGQEANALAAQAGIQNTPPTNVPTLPNGNLDKVAWEAELRKFRPTPALPSGASKMTVDNAFGGQTTFEADAGKKTDSVKRRDDFINNAMEKRGLTLLQAQQEWEASEKMGKDGAPQIGTDATNPIPSGSFNRKTAKPGSYFVRVEEETKDDSGRKVPAGSIIRMVIPDRAPTTEEQPKEAALPGGGKYQFSTGDPEKVATLERKVEKIKEKIEGMGASAPTERMVSAGPGARPVSAPTSSAEKKAHDERMKKYLKDLSEAEEALRKAEGK